MTQLSERITNITDYLSPSTHPDAEGVVRMGSQEELPPLSEVRQIRDIESGRLITHINGVALRVLPINQELSLG